VISELIIKIRSYEIAKIPDRIYCNQGLVQTLWDIHQESESSNERKFIRGLASAADSGSVSKKQFILIKELADFYQYKIESYVFAIKGVGEYEQK
jgi:hypothetical protein